MNEALSAGREDIVSYLPANQADAAHHLPQDSIDRGLDIHFRLVRHDNFQPMFKNVQGLLKERQEGAQASGSCTANTKKRPGRLADMPAFYNVSIAQLTPHRQGLMYMLEFDQPKLPKHFRSGKDPFIQFWERSRRLNVGALVCLWVDEEPVRLIFAVVCLRDIKSLTKTIDREVAGSNMLLLEAANDYFSYEPVLKALQASSEATLPFPHLLKLCPDKHGTVNGMVSNMGYNEVHDEAKREILAGATIVGITTTGAAKNQELIRRLNCKVVIVEEAAEVLEAHILVNLTASNEQLVLIGDHRQLRPKTQANYAFGAEKGLGLDVSLFERLVSQHNMPVHQLLVQRRMRPEIADLIRSTIYRDLVDGENVKSYPHVAGMAHNTFFLDHKHKEESEIHTLSHINTWEAHMVAAIAKHLLRKALEKHTLVFLDEADQKIVDDIDSSGLTGPENPEAASDAAQEPATNICHDTVRRRVRLATVDNFQGEESKVVLVSLVRSNDIGKAGFLNTTNRVNVLLSRAQHGMILVGNADTFCSSKTTPMWRDVIGQL
ncbi:hypothetical protein WJX84_010168 [Apatococcus fuscideae]|uniref:Uncharacterized protein n=1 Tax=Apatococcus fuscideae TaxID=2026836 RepID=A0AAW1SN85_9CHLO